MNQTRRPASAARPVRHTGVLAALVLVLTTLAGGAPAAAQDPLAVVDVRPLPGAVVTAPGAGLQARVVGDAEVDRVRVRVDGHDLAHTTAPVDGGGIAVAAHLGALAAGTHQLEVVAESGNTSTTRSWSITATPRQLGRLSGPDRFATAAAVSQDVHATGTAPAAVIARADDVADALAGAPLLLTSPDTLPAVTADELDRVLAAAAPVHVLGGAAAVSAPVAQAIEASGHPVVRHAGPDRYATAAAIADQLPASPTAVVASGTRFPDALAASVPAARRGWPVLLTPTDRLDAGTRAALARRGVEQVVLVGGEVAVGTGVEEDLDAAVPQVDRVAGPTRFATAVAVADRYLLDASEVALASGRSYPDALAAAGRAAAHGAPLLLVEPTAVPAETDSALRDRRPDTVVVHGGSVAVHEDVAAAALHAVVDGPGAPRVSHAGPGSGTTSRTISPALLQLDRPVVAASLVASASLDGTELPATAQVDTAGTGVAIDVLSPGDLPLEEPHTVEVVLRAEAPDGATVHHRHHFVLQADGHVFATVGALELVEPSAAVEAIGYHQSNHEGARQMAPADDGPPWHTMGHRGRRTGSRTAADVVADEHVEVVAPVTGTVMRAGTYVLYCDHTDHVVAIEPDGRPGIEVKLLHFRGLRVGPGDRVTAGETVIGDGPRRLPFTSQVDEYSSTGHGPHVHVEVVDTAIPNLPNGGSGSDGC